MKPRSGVVLSCFMSFIWIQHSLCAAKGNKWVCMCGMDGLPTISSDDHDPICFTSCNCKSGSTTEAGSTKKQMSSTLLVIILLSSLTLTVLILVASYVCYISQREKHHTEQFLSSSDKETRYNSVSNLVSHKSTSLPEFKVFISSPANPITGCIQKTSFLFRDRRGTFHGTLPQFSYSELENSTNKFCSSNLIGMGSSSNVYWGHLKDGRKVAVKRMKYEGEMNGESDFMTEIELISRLHHCHVVPLLGFCSENQGKHIERLLVFEYMAHGNLRECLDGVSGKFIDWSTRVSIALGAAKGLEYLHEAAAPRILHRDVKSTNILLDLNWRPKISDLGMAKRLRIDDAPSCSSSPVRMQGTFGYFAPEYALVGKASLMSDVFSFGVVLLELITGRQPIHKSSGKQESLILWASPRLLDSKTVISELPDPNLKGNYPEEEMQIMAYLAKECLLLDPDSRPTMSEVVQILSTIASEKFPRRNFSFNHVQQRINYDLASEMPEKQNQVSVEAEELIKPVVHLLPSSTHCVKKHVETAEVFSDECIEKQILHTSSNTRSFSSLYEETVDISEPQFESFPVPEYLQVSNWHIRTQFVSE